MDLGAYVQIDELEKVMVDNGIEVPRLRGLRLMKDEEVVSEDDIQEMFRNVTFHEVEDAVRCNFMWNARYSEYSSRTDEKVKEYIDYEKRDVEGVEGAVYDVPVRVHWEKIHGDKRKYVKYHIKKRRKRIREQYNLWNKYCGRDDVLYIHARLGAGNWGGYDCDEIVKNQPWYLEHCEDNFDRTYVDIYAKIK